MSTNGGATKGYEDPLAYLPRRAAQQFARNHIIYNAQKPAAELYVVISGRVKITMTDNGLQAISRFVRSEGMFGETCLVNPFRRSETALVLEDAILMSWSRPEIEQQVEREPRLGIALWQYLLRECLELQDRIESMAVHKTQERISLGLLQLAVDLGSPMPDGSLRIDSLTHQTIAEFVGTSREIVTFHMNRLRRLGFVRYSRKNIDVYSQALREILMQQGVRVPQINRSFQVA